MRQFYYSFHSITKVLISKLCISPDEAAHYINITIIQPPEESEEFGAKFNGSTWNLISRQIQPILNKTTLLANSSDSIIITDLPEYYELYFDEKKYESEDSQFEITIDTPGEYTLEIHSPQRLPFKTIIEAV